MEKMLEGTFEIAPAQDGTVILLAPGFAKTLGVALRFVCEQGWLPQAFAAQGHSAIGSDVVALDKLSRILSGGEE